MKITFVCTGNTCRSPMAEGIFREMIKKEKLSDIEVSSAGLSAFPGDEVSPNAVKSALRYGADISSHRAKGMNYFDMLDTDIFVCMSQSHENYLQRYVPVDRILLLGGGISDPYGANEKVYDKCADEIYNGLEELLDKIKEMTCVCEMKDEHIKEIAEIENECFSNPWSEKSLEEEIQNENAFFLTAKRGESVEGYIGLHSVAGECYIDNIAVKKSKRGKGVASALLDRAIREAVLRNDDFISLEVRKSNTAAINLYSRFGFKKAGERKNFYTEPLEDGDIMTLDLKVKE